MTAATLYALGGVVLVAIGLFGLIVHTHLVRKVLALNVMGSGVFLVLVGLADRTGGPPDPVPHAMVLTGIVVAVSATAVALVLAVRVKSLTGRATLPLDDD